MKDALVQAVSSIDAVLRYYMHIYSKDVEAFSIHCFCVRAYFGIVVVMTGGSGRVLFASRSTTL